MVIQPLHRERSLFIWIILGIFTAIFAAEHIWGIPMLYEKASGIFGVSIATLVAFGGVCYNLVVHDHQYFRLITAGFIHLDLMHLFYNSIGLFIAIVHLEQLISRIWIICLFMIGVIGSSLASIYFNDPNTISAGASGGVMALLAAVVIFGLCSNHARETKTAIVTQALQILIPSMLPFINGKSVDIAGHIGGFFTGSIASGFIVLIYGYCSHALNTIISISILLPLLYGAQYGAYQLYRQYAEIKTLFARK